MGYRFLALLGFQAHINMGFQSKHKYYIKKNVLIEKQQIK